MNSNQEIFDSIRRIVRALRISSRAAEKDLGVSSAQLFVLQRLRDGREVSLNELAARTLTHQSSVSVVVSKLAERGLLSREKAKEDERRLAISITAKGLELVKKAPEPIQEKLIDAIDALSPIDQEVLGRGLRQVVSAIDTDVESPVPLFFEEK